MHVAITIMHVAIMQDKCREQDAWAERVASDIELQKQFDCNFLFLFSNNKK